MIKLKAHVLPMLGAGVLPLSALFPLTALAQASANQFQLEEVMVTAQRREQSLQDVGLAVNALSGEQILNNGITDSQQLGDLLPALKVGGGGGANTTFFVRGVGNFTVNGYSDPAMAFTYDDVYIGRPTSAQNFFFDIQRIELLKGPQGTLYGRNATAGAINVIPVKPSFDEVSGFISASFGNYDTVNTQGAINIPVNDHSALRFSAMVAQHDGYLNDGTSDEDRTALRAQYLTDIGDNLSVRIAADYAETGGKGPGASYAGSYALNRATGDYEYTPTGFAADEGLYSPASQAYRETLFLGITGRNVTPLSNEPYMDNDAYGVNAEINYEAEAGTLTIIPAYRKSTLDSVFANPAFYGYTQEEDEQTSLEVRFATKDFGMFRFIVGGNYFDEDVDGNYTFAQQGLSAYQEFTSDSTSVAVFADTTASVTDAFRIVAGIRYTDDQKDMDGQADVLLNICTLSTPYGRPDCPTAPLLPLTDSPADLGAPFIVPTLPGPPNATPVGATGAILALAPTSNQSSSSEQKVTWRAGIEYDVTTDAMLYATYSTGYRSGGFALAFGFETFDPEYLDAYTIGLKSTLLDGRLNLNLEGFYWEYSDQQISHIGVDARGNNGLFTQNIGESTIQGFEIETVFLATETTRLNATVQYLDATFDKFTYMQGGATKPVSGCDVSPDGAAWQIDCTNKEAYNSPEWTMNFGIQQIFAVGDYQLTAALNTQYKAEQVVGFEYLEHNYADSYWKTDASLSLSQDNAAWQATAWIRNMSDAEILNTSPFNSNLAVGTNSLMAPRTYGVRLDWNF